MNIGAAAEKSGLSAKTIRFYEEIGLVAPTRKPNGYREFEATDINKLRFVGQARSLGFSVDDCRHLLSLYEDKDRASADVKALARSHLAEIDRKITELADMRSVLNTLVDACRGNARPECPILDGLSHPVGAKPAVRLAGHQGTGQKSAARPPRKG